MWEDNMLLLVRSMAQQGVNSYSSWILLSTKVSGGEEILAPTSELFPYMLQLMPRLMSTLRITAGCLANVILGKR